MSVSTLAVRVATAAPTYRVNPFRQQPVPNRAQLHMMNRMGCGFSPATFAQMRRMGGAGPWFNRQLAPGRIRESAKVAALQSWYPGLRQSPAQQWQNNQTGVMGGWEYARDLGSYTTLRRMYTNRPVLETMVDFWSNHFHIKAGGDLAWVQRYNYDRTIRAHALGRFDQMLEAVSLHPSMLLFLDNWRSVRNAPNENHGRELLELHTVGRSSGYTEAMVKDSARILSGYTVDAWETWNGFYDAAKHTTGRVQVLGFTHPNASSDGRALTKSYLRYLAHHPATARTIARKLALRFVSDTPSAGLVNHLARVFLRSGTDIKTTLRALVAHPEFKRSAGKKVTTPVDDLVHTARVLQVNAFRPRSDESFAITVAWLHKSMPLYSWPRPDGAPEHNAAWSSASRVLGSFQMHWGLAGGWWPREAVAYKPAKSWLPRRRIRFDQYVDYLCRVVHGRGSSPRVLKAAVQATGCRPGEVITGEHALAGWMFPRLMAVLLDSPEHMSR